MKKKIALKADVEIQRYGDDIESEVAFYVRTPDGSPLTGNQIVEAIAEAVLLYWDNCPMETREDSEFDS